MGKLGGFLQIERHGIPYRDPDERARDYREFLITRPTEELREQGARCMDCGVPFCHNGCPLGNLIPDWNDLVYRDRWQDAIAQLHATNNFPELTGRLCPAPCEAACVLEIRENDAVTIKQIELAIVDRAWEEGWIVPRPPRHETGQSVAVVGSGPAGMAAAQQLRRAGHSVTLFERDEAAGGLARFGVPDFKIEKRVVQRRVEQLIAEGVELRCGVDVGGAGGVGVAGAARIVRRGRARHRLARPARPARPRPRAGRCALRDGLPLRPQPLGRARVRPHTGRFAARRALVDNGRRQGRRGDRRWRHRRRLRRQRAARGCALDRPAGAPARAPGQAPGRAHAMAGVAIEVPHELRDGGGPEARAWASRTTRSPPRTSPATPTAASRRCTSPKPSPRPPSARSRAPSASFPRNWCCWRWASWHPEPALLDGLGVEKDPRGNVKAVKPYTTSVEGVFAAGDARRGQSLIVWAINEGRQCARMVDRYLAGKRNGAIAGGEALPEDQALAGHADADEGPEGPPNHVTPGVPAE